MTFKIEVVYLPEAIDVGYRVAGQVFDARSEARAYVKVLERTAAICEELRVWLYARTPLGTAEAENVAMRICGEYHDEFVAILDKVRE